MTFYVIHSSKNTSWRWPQLIAETCRKLRCLYCNKFTHLYKQLLVLFLLNLQPVCCDTYVLSQKFSSLTRLQFLTSTILCNICEKARGDVLRAVLLKIIVLWDMMQCELISNRASSERRSLTQQCGIPQDLNRHIWEGL